MRKFISYFTLFFFLLITYSHGMQLLKEGVEIFGKRLFYTSSFNFSKNSYVPKGPFADPISDISFKKMFVDKEELTVDFLNATLRLAGDRIVREVKILPQENLPFGMGMKYSILDFICTDQRNFQYIVEVQRGAFSDYLKRVQHYVSYRYATQLDKGGKYKELSPVVLLSVLDGILFDDALLNHKYLTYHDILERDTHVNYLKDLSFVFVELPKFQKKVDSLKNNEDYWLYLLKNAESLKEIPSGTPSIVQEAFSILEQHRWSKEEREQYMKAKIRIMDEQYKIEELTDKAEKEGKARGLKEGRTEMARKMREDKEPIEKIERYTGLSKEEIDKL
ncbi:MAG: Rpn family recombination-promoting nuclease/putative transposase [Alphaproteobacteria bacterium]